MEQQFKGRKSVVTLYFLSDWEKTIMKALNCCVICKVDFSGSKPDHNSDHDEKLEKVRWAASEKSQMRIERELVKRIQVGIGWRQGGVMDDGSLVRFVSVEAEIGWGGVISCVDRFWVAQELFTWLDIIGLRFSPFMGSSGPQMHYL